MNELLPLVTNIPALQALAIHLDTRIGVLKNEFLFAKEMTEVRGLQRAIKELEDLKKLRERVLAEVSNG